MYLDPRCLMAEPPGPTRPNVAARNDENRLKDDQGEGDLAVRGREEADGVGGRIDSPDVGDSVADRIDCRREGAE
ncbi:hypothetical protein GH714_000342 [Hevea brasiliensis]|uniref:Uncharacterized protein n=1 Tax=Hevea brasiliensis TaxID=3981 RepID=A0A6A6M8A8_HEVBR|nr:hypothetical protein GH714_000342 [Hevea brasiliensis]